MKDEADYSLYKCPFAHIEKECGHELHGPEGYENTYSVWCACGFRGPVLCLDPVELRLESRMPGHDECAQVSKSAVNELVRLCDTCGKNRPKNDVIKDIGTYGTENICKDCLQDYDPYEGIVRVYPRNNRRTKP